MQTKYKRFILSLKAKLSIVYTQHFLEQLTLINKKFLSKKLLLKYQNFSFKVIKIASLIKQLLVCKCRTFLGVIV